MIQARIFHTYPGLFTPESFVKASLRTIMSLYRNVRRFYYERDFMSARVALVTAQTMGGYKGNDPTDFLPPWSQPEAAARKRFVSAAVDTSITAALKLGLVGQAVLDALVDHGYEP